jgi:glycosyltransferase involved in cell wall biosynthesis
VKKICFVTTSPLIVNFFLVPHLLYLARRYEMSLAVRLPGEVPLRPLSGIEIIPVNIRREIAPVADAAALVSLARLYRERKFDLVHSFGPKAGLLSAAAGRLAGTRARLHTFTGQVWSTRTGPMRALLRAADVVTARLATHVFADSASQRDFLESERVVERGRVEVLGHGSITGVDLRRFRPDAGMRREVRAELDIPEAAPLILFMARLTRDKGVLDVAHAFLRLDPRSMLVMVGPDEQRLRGEVRALVGDSASRVRFVDYTDQPERYMAAADVLCVPSHREGFGSVLIGAAAAGVPAVASRIYGVVDAVVEGETGLLFTPGDAADLADKLTMLLSDSALREKLGAAARSRAETHFSEDAAVRALEARYEEILSGCLCASQSPA